MKSSRTSSAGKPRCNRLGKNPRQSVEILGSKSFHDFIAKKKVEYDLLLLDSPPILAVSDTLILSTVADVY